MKLPVAPRHIPMLGAAVVLIAAFLFGAFTYDRFASWAVVRNLLVDNAFLGVAAIGATFVILSGGIDLSVASVMALTSILIAKLVETSGTHPALAIALALLLGTAFGAAQGALIQAFELPAFMVTLAGMFLARGIAFWIHPQSIGIHHDFIATTLNDSLSFRIPLGPRGISIPLTVDILLAVFAVSCFVLSSTRFGRSVYAVGDDATSARLMGVPVARTRVLVYTLSGLLSSLAGVVYTLYNQSGNPAEPRGTELDAIAAVVIGGTLLRGGVGSVTGTLLGVLIFGLVQTLIAFQAAITDVSSWWTRIIVGGLVLVFLTAQRGVEWLGSRRSS